MAEKWPIWGTLVPKSEPMGAQRHQVVAQLGARCKPKGSQGAKMRAQRGANGSQCGPHDSPEGPKLEPRGPQERKIEKVKNARSQEVDKLKNHENLKNSNVEILIFHSFYNEN
jgi:hypothetical protein